MYTSAGDYKTHIRLNSKPSPPPSAVPINYTAPVLKRESEAATKWQTDTDGKKETSPNGSTISSQKWETRPGDSTALGTKWDTRSGDSTISSQKWDTRSGDSTISSQKWEVPHQPENLAGMWIVIHMNAKLADTLNDGGMTFVTQLWNLASNFPCGTCKAHFLEYLQNHDPHSYAAANPMEKYVFLKWTWIFHNAVSARITPLLPPDKAKRIMPWEECLALFVGGKAGLCSEGCGH